MHWKSRSRVLGILLAAFVAALAVSASAAQAGTWTMKQNGESLLHLEVTGFFNLGEIRTNSGTIHCKTGLWGPILVQLNPDHTVASMLVHGAFSGCGYLEFEEVCEVSSPGAPAEEIAFKASGPMEVKAGVTSGVVEGKEITKIVATGEECPFSEINNVLSGSMRVTIAKAEEEVTAHAVELNEIKLLLGKEEAFIDGKEKAAAITGEVKGEGGAKFSLAFK